MLRSKGNSSMPLSLGSIGTLANVLELEEPDQRMSFYECLKSGKIKLSDSVFDSICTMQKSMVEELETILVDILFEEISPSIINHPFLPSSFNLNSFETNRFRIDYMQKPNKVGIFVFEVEVYSSPPPINPDGAYIIFLLDRNLKKDCISSMSIYDGINQSEELDDFSDNDIDKDLYLDYSLLGAIRAPYYSSREETSRVKSILSLYFYEETNHHPVIWVNIPNTTLLGLKVHNTIVIYLSSRPIRKSFFGDITSEVIAKFSLEQCTLVNSYHYICDMNQKLLISKHSSFTLDEYNFLRWMIMVMKYSNFAKLSDDSKGLINFMIVDQPRINSDDNSKIISCLGLAHHQGKTIRPYGFLH